MRGEAGLQEAGLIVLNGRPELVTTAKLLTRPALATSGCEEIRIRYGDQEDYSEGELVVPKLAVETMDDNQQGSSGSVQSND